MFTHDQFQMVPIQKIMTDKLFVHTGPATHTHQPDPNKFQFLGLQKSRFSLGTVSVPSGSVTVLSPGPVPFGINSPI